MKGKWLIYKVKGINEHELCLLPLSMQKDFYVFISKFSTTNLQYEKFLHESNLPLPEGQDWNGENWNESISPLRDKKFNKPDQPIVCTSYWDSLKYIKWLNSKESSIKYFLPNTTLWEFATFGRIGDFQLIRQPMLNEKTVFNAPLEFSKMSNDNTFGIVGLIGNIWEWVEPKNKDALRGDKSLAIPNDSKTSRNRISRILRRNMSHGIGSHVLIDLFYSENREIRGTSYLDNPFETEPRMSSVFLEDGVNTKHSDLGFRVAGLLHKSELPYEVLQRIEEFTKKLTNEFREEHLKPKKLSEEPHIEFYSKIRKGKIKEAIEYLLTKIPNNNELKKALTIIEYRYKTNKTSFNTGVITFEEKSVCEVRILNSLIDTFENYA